MKKTLNGTILVILLVWSIYFIYVTKNRILNLKGVSPTVQFGLFLLATVVFIIVLILLVVNSSIDKKPGSGIAGFFKSNTTLSEDDEREKSITAEVSKKNYVTISNLIIILMMILVTSDFVKTVTVNQILITIAITVTLESLIFLYRFYRIYRQ